MLFNVEHNETFASALAVPPRFYRSLKLLDPGEIADHSLQIRPGWTRDPKSFRFEAVFANRTLNEAAFKRRYEC